jgi:SH3-like domain-containing protein
MLARPGGTLFVIFSNSALARVVMLLTLGLSSVAMAQDSPARSVGASGLPLPRFASLASSEVNVRTGPTTDHPIRWLYTRRGLPVSIVEESDVWRRIVDPDGETGWVHSSLLSVQRTAIVIGSGIQDLRRSAAPDGRVVARLEPGVIAKFDECEGDWCRVEVADERGWLPRAAIWGAGPSD